MLGSKSKHTDRMIPLSLQIKNFLSYGAEVQTVNFEPYHLICLSGRNGHGKSALLDAMTWAVWGQARKTTGTSKPDQGLIRLGAKTMTVGFDFLCNGKKYRVKREATATGSKMVSWLDFGVYDAEGQLTALTDKTIRDTQAVIEKTIGLSYDTFVNSTFLRQGNSNEFSRKSPKERKEIVCSILGLGLFESVRKEALARARAAQVAADNTQALMQRVQQDVNRCVEVQASLQLLETQIVTAQTDLASLQKTVETLQQELHQQRLIVARIPEINQRLEKTIEEQLHGEQDMQAAYVQWRELHKILLVTSVEEAGSTTLRQLQLNLEKLLNEQARIQIQAQQVQDVLMQEQRQIDIQFAEHERDSQRKVYDLSLKVSGLSAEISRLKQEKSKGEMLLQEQQHTLQKLVQKQQQLAQISVEQQKVQRFIERRRAQYVRLQNMHQTWQQKLQTLAYEISSLKTESTCPTCLTPLDEQKRLRICSNAARSEHALKRLLQRIDILLPEITSSGKELAARVRDLQTQTADGSLIEHRIKELRESSLATNLKELSTTLIGLEESCTIEAASLESLQKEVALIPQLKSQRLQELSQGATSLQLAQLNTQLEQINKELVEVRNQLQINALRDSYTALPIEQQRELKQERFVRLVSVIRQQRKLGKELAFTRQQLQQAQEAQAKVQHLDTQLQLLGTQLTLVSTQLAEFREQRAALGREYSLLERSQQELEQCALAQKDLIAQAEEYKLIAAGLSKEGIQALLIEEAIPEIESEANALLARLTDNSSQIMIESLKDLKTGGVKETLDIRVSDTFGIRPYEMFSGGEAFRIDFSLRIALSKLLARRAGASLQTLIIDEGFGSQDEEGLQHIMDTLYKVQEDFAKIIIVSHLPSMKEQFPVHFVVNKKAEGSTITVVEQG